MRGDCEHRGLVHAGLGTGRGPAIQELSHVSPAGMCFLTGGSLAHHVAGRARPADCSPCRPPPYIHVACQAQVCQLGPAVAGNEQVRGLDVTVYEAPACGGKRT